MPNTRNIIRFEDAVDHLYALLSMYVCDSLGVIARTKAFGGTITRSGFLGTSRLLTTYEGIIAWVCWNSTSDNYKSFFLSFEQTREYRPDDLPIRTYNENLAATLSTFICPEDLRTKDLVRNFLKNHSYAESFDSKTISREDVRTFSNNFLATFPKDNYSEPYNLHPFCFFEDGDDDVFKFLNNQKDSDGTHREVCFIRYYFGFQDDLSNRLRVILIAVDKDGNNLCKKSDGTDYIILQKSWPPGGN